MRWTETCCSENNYLIESTVDPIKYWTFQSLFIIYDLISNCSLLCELVEHHNSFVWVWCRLLILTGRIITEAHLRQAALSECLLLLLLVYWPWRTPKSQCGGNTRHPQSHRQYTKGRSGVPWQIYPDQGTGRGKPKIRMLLRPGVRNPRIIVAYHHHLYRRDNLSLYFAVSYLSIGSLIDFDMPPNQIQYRTRSSPARPSWKWQNVCRKCGRTPPNDPPRGDWNFYPSATIARFEYQCDDDDANDNRSRGTNE